MKKLIALGLALVCILSLCSCRWNSQKAVATVISENVTKIDITHCIGGETRIWSIEGTGILDLKEWFDKLSYNKIQVKEGQSPGDSDGGEVYTFVFVGGEWPGFSYVINGENACYIQSEGNWFAVNNPSIPPVYFDSGADLASQFPHFTAKILEIHDNYILVEPEVGMEELKSADKFEILLDDVDNPTELQVDDSVIIVYDGEILETYPAKLGKVYSVGKMMIIIPVDNSKEAAPNEAIGAYTYEELSEMPANELLDLFIQNGLVINDDLKASFTEEELQKLFKVNIPPFRSRVSGV